jgi:hypothetical protein
VFAHCFHSTTSDYAAFCKGIICKILFKKKGETKRNLLPTLKDQRVSASSGYGGGYGGGGGGYGCCSYCGGQSMSNGLDLNTLLILGAIAAAAAALYAAIQAGKRRRKRDAVATADDEWLPAQGPNGGAGEGLARLVSTGRTFQQLFYDKDI